MLGSAHPQKGAKRPILKNTRRVSKSLIIIDFSILIYKQNHYILYVLEKLMKEDLQLIIDEYPLDYCEMLEDVYGRGLMSEGGTKAIDELFDGVNLSNTRVLDVGSGLGGLAFYLAKEYNCTVSGLEINEEMIQEAVKRIPSSLASNVSFHHYSDFSKLSFKSSHFDIICSKGTLVHVNDKGTLFKELHRLLKDDGQFVLNDWLSSQKNGWGPRIKRMCELEDLTLYPTIKTDYQLVLKDSGFHIAEIRDCSPQYSKYNLQLVEVLHQKKISFIQKHGEKAWQESVDGYKLIAESQADGELLVTEFIATKLI